MITRTLSGPPPVRRVRHSARWRRFSLLLLTAAAVLYMAYKSPGGRGHWGEEEGDVRIHVSVARRLGMEEGQGQAGDAVLSATGRTEAQRQSGTEEGQGQAGDAALSATARKEAHRQSQLGLARPSAAGSTGGAQSSSAVGAWEAAGAEEEDEGAELAAAVREDAAAAAAAEERQEKRAAAGGGSLEAPAAAEAAATAAATAGSAGQGAAIKGGSAGLDPGAYDAGAASAAGSAVTLQGNASSSAAAAAAAAAAVGRQSTSGGTALEVQGKADIVGPREGDAHEAADRLRAAGSSAASASNGAVEPAAVGAAAAGAGEGLAGVQQQQDGSGVPLSELERALRGCRTLECLREAHKQPKHPGQFNFPHFLILGFPKTATTSLFHHLIQHPSIMAPRVKEPNFFDTLCQGNALSCPLQEQEEYITGTMHLDLALQARLFMATFEGSVHYSQAGAWLAPQLRELMPWLKLVLSLREPISQAISMLQHNLDHGRRPACYGPDASVFKCILRKLEDEDETYAPRLQAWADAFPADQLFVLQYENLTDASKMRAALRDVKRFVGIDAKLPSDDLGLHNSRKSERGWPMARSEYERLVELARRDAQRLASIVRQHGFADADRWLANWERAWQSNLESCQGGPDGLCLVQLT